MQTTHFHILLLAAGLSSRMGQPKQFLTIQGNSLLTRSATAAIKSKAFRTWVVLGNQAERATELLKSLPVSLVINEHFQLGMGSSLTCGVKSILNSEDPVDGILVMVCDQPHVTTAHLNKLLHTCIESGAQLVVSQYDNSIGVPAVFGKSYVDQLLLLNPKQGAKSIIHQHLSEVKTVSLPGGEIDLDTPEDLARFLQARNKKL